MPTNIRPSTEQRTCTSARNWLLRFVAAVALGVAGLELLLRLFLWSPLYLERHPRLGIVGRPHASVVRTDEGWTRGRLDSTGHNDLPPTGPVETRVVVIGDSFTQAIQVGFDENYCALAESQLTGVEIVNAGVGGRSPAYAPAVLDEYEFGDVDVVAIQISEFDTEELFAPHRLHLVRGDEGEWREKIPEGFTRSSAAGRLKLWLMKHSALLNAVISRLESLVDVERSRLEARLNAPRAHAEAQHDDTTLPSEEAWSAMDHILARVRETGARPLLIFLPEILYTADGLPVRRPAHRAFWHEYARDRAIPITDPTDDFRDHFEEHSEPAHGFHNSELGRGHMNRVGHRITAKHLVAALRGVLP